MSYTCGKMVLRIISAELSPLHYIIQEKTSPFLYRTKRNVRDLLLNKQSNSTFLTSELASLVAQLVKNLPAKQEIGLDSWVRKMPWRRKWQPTPMVLPGKSHEQRNLAGSTGSQRVRHDLVTNNNTDSCTLSSVLYMISFSLHMNTFYRQGKWSSMKWDY